MGGAITEQLNIEGKRSGEGFVAHKAMLASALSRTLAERITLMDLTIGRKGFLGYLKALGGSNIVKVAPSNGGASESQATVKKLRVVCGANTSYLDDGAWIKQSSARGAKGATPRTFAEVRVSPSNSVKPNVGATELAEALNRLLPFAEKGDKRPGLECVNFTAKEGKLTLASADGFRLAVVTLNFDDGEGQALIHRNDLVGIAGALKRAKRARIGFEDGGNDGKSLVLDTELIRYRWRSYNGVSFPEYVKLMPVEHTTFASFDTFEAIKAVNSLKVLASAKGYAVDLAIGNGKAVLASPDDKGQAEIVADTDGEAIKVRVDGSYLVQAFKACGGMVELKLTKPYAPMLFTTDGYRLVVMPMATRESVDQMKRDNEAKAEAEAEAKPAEQVKEPEKVAEAGGEPVETIVAEAEKVAAEASEKAEAPTVEAEKVAGTRGEHAESTRGEPVESKPKRGRKREPVAVA